MKQTVGLIGYPVGHSISPAFQQAAFDHLGLDIRYELWETEPDNLGEVVQNIRSPQKLGANITVPYKEQVMSLLDGIDGLASDIGAVNTIARRDAGLIGYNTDAGGFLRALEEEGRFDPRGKMVTMLGAGGVARAIGFVLVRSGVESLTLFDIDIGRAERLATDLVGADLCVSHITVLSSNKGDFEEAVFSADLLVNCTPVGMKHSAAEGQSPLPKELISPRSVVYDVVYNPIRTPLLEIAEEVGARTLGGLSMLVYQGATAFELWTGRRAPVDVMLERAKSAL
ncbi:shikimate dehydrogenase [Dehalococcoidia bacterium]|nr:shikimate dehydrogenase [Dehalococcoidia bacterium]MCL0050622.1 shikimate dehydrogenase [Dehalococcoidia bacterium]MCL0064606.1 shikimate dehydrogenase [Dehalococcoidia bacterium]